MTITEEVEEIEEITLEGAIESRLVELIDDALEERPDGLIIRGRHETEFGASPAIVCRALREGDADIPGWWKVAVSVSLEFRENELTPVEADFLFRAIDGVMGSTAPSLQPTLATDAVAVAGIEYDDAFEIQREDDSETRTYNCMAVCGLIDPNS